MQKENQYQHQLAFCQARLGWRDTRPFLALWKYIFYSNLAKCPKYFLGILAADRVLKEVNKLVTVSGQWATSKPWRAAKPRCREQRPSQEAMDVGKRCDVGSVFSWWTTLTIHYTLASRENGSWLLNCKILRRIQILNERLQSIQLSPLKSDSLE